MKLLLSPTTALLLLLAARTAIASEPERRAPVIHPQPPSHVSVWTPEFPAPIKAKGSTTIPLYGDLGSPSLLNLYGHVSIGTPPQTFRLAFETAETTLWIPNNKPSSCPHTVYNHSESSSYEADGRGAISGSLDLYVCYGFYSRDTIRVGDFALANVTFAEATQVMKPGNFADAGVDGWFGLAPSLEDNAVLQRLVSSGVLDQPVFAFYLNQKKTKKNGGEPAGSVGELTIGAIDKRRYTGDIHYVDARKTIGWVVSLDAVTIAGKGVESFVDIDDDIDSKAAILPTWPFILGPSEQIKKLAAAVGTITDQGFIDCSSQGPDIVIKIGGAEFTLTKDDYTLHIDETNCLWAFMGQEFGGWWLGQPFLKKVYSVFEFVSGESSFGDYSAKRIGFALAT
ncbi:hypothetical protein Gpo141_00013415 [Globisporangium polare]